jgi:N-formylglutamate amidohydrolase
VPGHTHLVLDSPRSGTACTADFGHACGRQAPRDAEGTHVGKLFDFCKGLLWRCQDDGTPIYARRLRTAEASRRIGRCWHRYHAVLSMAVEAASRRHAGVIHLSGHSGRTHAGDACGLGGLAANAARTRPGAAARRPVPLTIAPAG